MTYKDTSGEDPVLTIVTSDVLTAPVAHSAGARYLVIDNLDADADDDVDAGSTLKGSYQWQMHGSPTIPLSASIDVTGTIQALEASNQNFYGFNCHDVAAANPRNVYDNTEGERWVEFVSFLEGSKDTDIKVFGVMTHPGGIGTGKRDAYGNVGGYESDGVTHIERPETAAGKYAVAAAELSLLSLTYPNLIGFTIDDFPAGHLLRGPSQYTREHVKIIQGGAESHNDSFEFWPTHYAGHALKTAIPSTRIGFTYGFPTTASEFVSADHTFRIPKGVTINSAVLKFIYDDDYDTKPDDMSENSGDGNYIGYEVPTVHKGVHLNGALLHQEDISYDKRIQIFEQDVTGDLVAGTNTLKFILSGSAATNTYKDRVFSYGDIRLEVEYRLAGSTAVRKRTLTEGRAPRPLTRPLISAPTFSVNSGTMSSHHLHYKYNTYGSPSQSITGRPVAETNDNYRYLADSAGAFVFYPNYTGTIMNNVGKVFEAYDRALPDKRIIHGQQGFLHKRDSPTKRHIEPWTLSQKFKTASANTDGFVVWNLPCEQISSSHLHPHGRAYGIFAEKDAGAGYDVRAHFIRKQAARYGHYQRFVTNYEMPSGATLSYKFKTYGGTNDYYRYRLFPSASHSNPENDDLEVITKVVFTSNTLADYGAASGANYLKIFSSADRYNFWFNDGSGDSAPSATGTETEVDISGLSAASGAIAAEFCTAVNSLADFVGASIDDAGPLRHAGTNVYVTSSGPKIAGVTEASAIVGTLSGLSVTTQRSGNYDWFNQEVTGGSDPTQIYTHQLTSSTKIGFEVRAGPIGYGDANGIAWLSSSINIGGVDLPLSRSAWSFESWFSGSSLQELYTDVTDFYGAVDTAASYHNFVVEKRADGTWKYNTPSHGDSVYVEDERATYTYDEKSLRWRKLASLVSDLVIEDSLLVKTAVLREGLYTVARSSPYTISFTDDLKSSSILLDTPSEIDTTYYASGSDYIRILRPGTYKLSYTINFDNVGASAPTGTVVSYMVTSSVLSGTSTPWPPKLLGGTSAYSHFMGISASHTIGGASNTSYQTLKAGDELRLYADRLELGIFSAVPATVSTEEDAVQIMLEKVK